MAIKFLQFIRKIIFLLLILFLVSCNEETQYRTEIILENNTNYNIDVTVFPKPDYAFHENGYKAWDDDGSYSSNNFIIKANDFNWLFVTKNMDIEPYQFINNIFDSIHVVINNEFQTKIIFKPNTVINYPDNPFSEDSQWNFEVVEGDEPDMFHQNPVQSDCYTFIIRE